MSLETDSSKRRRVYQRAFDHEEAQRLRAEGWTYLQLADRYGVSKTAVERVCNPKVRAKLDAATRRNLENKRRPCRGGCGRLVWHPKRQSGYCTSCYGARLTAADERPGELRCTKCRRWFPDTEFSRVGGRKTRRGRNSWCRGCGSAARAAYRREHRDAEVRSARNYKRKGKAMSEWVVLRSEAEGHWVEVGGSLASSRMHAVERVADRPGAYVAVSAGQLSPFRVEETVAFKVADSANGRKPRNEAAPAAATDQAKELGRRQEQVLQVVREHPGLAPGEVSSAVGFGDPTQVYGVLNRLAERGLVQKVNGKWSAL